MENIVFKLQGNTYRVDIYPENITFCFLGEIIKIKSEKTTIFVFYIQRKKNYSYSLFKVASVLTTALKCQQLEVLVQCCQIATTNRRRLYMVKLHYGITFPSLPKRCELYLSCECKQMFTFGERCKAKDSRIKFYVILIRVATSHAINKLCQNVIG